MTSRGSRESSGLLQKRNLCLYSDCILDSLWQKRHKAVRCKAPAYTCGSPAQKERHLSVPVEGHRQLVSWADPISKCTSVTYLPLTLSALYDK